MQPVSLDGGKSKPHVCGSMSLCETFRRLERIEQTLDSISKLMATQADVEAALQTLTTAIGSAASAIQTKLNALQAQISAGASGPDLAPQVAEIQADIAAVQSLGSETPAAPPAPAA